MLIHGNRDVQTAGRAPRTLMLVENNPVPADRRVWAECLALREAGFDVTVVCPQGRDAHRKRFERLEGVEIYRYPAPFGSGSSLGYLREYASSLWHTWRITRGLARVQRFDVVHAANPPDFLLAAAWPLKRRGARFIFDHHDLAPELYRARLQRGGQGLYWIARALERLSFKLADVVIATNDSYRNLAIARGGKRSEDVFVVRNGPSLEQFRPMDPDASLKRGAAHLITYVGMMARQDGVDLALRALAALERDRRDWRAVFVGDGEVLEEMRLLARTLGIAGRVEFTGFVADDERIRRVLAASDVCLAPEPKNGLNDASTMIKVGEYMAMSRPVVAFDLTETRVTASEAAAYATPNDVESFAGLIHELLADPERRRRMGAAARSRAEQLSWRHSKPHLLAAYTRALQGETRSTSLSSRQLGC